MSDWLKENPIQSRVTTSVKKGLHHESLNSPRVVEEVIFKSCPTPLGKKQRAFPTDQMKPADRIERIVNDLFEFGVPIEVLFDVDDLLKAKNIPKVKISHTLRYFYPSNYITIAKLNLHCL